MRWLFTGVALFRELDARSSLRQRVSMEDEVHWHAVGTHLSWICFLLVVPHRRRPAEQVKRCPGRQLACCGQQPARQTLAKRGDALPAPNLGSAATSMPGR